MAGPASAGAALPLDYLVVLDLEAACDDPTDPYRPEIVEFPWLVFDLATGTVLDHKQIFVTPRWNTNPNPPPDAVRGLGTDVAFAPSLADAIMQFDAYIYQSFVVAGKSFYLLTDGPWDLKDLLFVEAARKAIVLAPYFRTYVNLRAEFSRCFPGAPVPIDRKTMFSYLDISTEPRASGLDECIALAAVVSCLLGSGHRFTSPEIVSDYEWTSLPARVPAIATPVASAVPVGGIIRLRGLPWTCTEQDIVNFLQGLTIVPSGIHFVRNSHGKATGEAFVQLDSPDAVNIALTRHKQSMGRRYIEVFKSSPIDMSNHLGRADARRHMHASHFHNTNKGHSSVTYTAQEKPPSQLAQQSSSFSGTASPSSQKSLGGSGQDLGSALSPSSSIGLPPFSKIANHNLNSAGKAQRNNGSRTGRDGTANSGISLNHPKIGSGSGTGLSYIVRVIGLPKNAVADDLLPLFDGLEMVGEGIHIVPSLSGGECGGEAFVELTSEAWAKKAVARSGSTITCALGNLPGSPPQVATVEVKKSSYSQLKSAFSGAHGNRLTTGGTDTRGKRNGGGGKNLSGEPRFFLRIRNVDESVSGEEICELFEKFHIADNDVKFIKPPTGNGNTSSADKKVSTERVARVSFRSKEDRDAALSTNKRVAILGGGQVQLEDGGSDTRAHKASKGSSAADAGGNASRVVRMRGLPYTSNEDDIVQFFEGYAIAPGGISRGKDRHGRASGEAWVTFVSAEDAKEVVSKLDKAHMGSRYIELKF